MRIVLAVEDYAAMKDIQKQAAYQHIKDKKVQTEPIFVKKEQIGIVVDTLDLSPQELEKIKILLGTM